MTPKTLTSEEKIIHTVATGFHDRFLVETGATGMCFRSSIFLAQYLSDKHMIFVEPIVGYVYDGESDFSHVWLEFGGKITDVSLSQTEPGVTKTGALIVNGHTLRPGQISYRYMRSRHEDSENWLSLLRNDPIGSQVLEHTQKERTMMLQIAADPSLWLPYLNEAPDGYDYAQLSSIVRWATL